MVGSTTGRSSASAQRFEMARVSSRTSARVAVSNQVVEALGGEANAFTRVSADESNSAAISSPSSGLGSSLGSFPSSHGAYEAVSRGSNHRVHLRRSPCPVDGSDHRPAALVARLEVAAGHLTARTRAAPRIRGGASNPRSPGRGRAPSCRWRRAGSRVRTSRPRQDRGWRAGARTARRSRLA